MSFLGERVGMTEAARLHFDSDLSRPWLRNLSLDHLKRSTRATYLDDAHAGHTCSPKTHDSRALSPDLHTTIDDRIPLRVQRRRAGSLRERPDWRRDHLGHQHQPAEALRTRVP